MVHLQAVNTLAHGLITSQSVRAGGGIVACNELSSYMDGCKLRVIAVQPCWPLISATAGEL